MSAPDGSSGSLMGPDIWVELAGMGTDYSSLAKQHRIPLLAARLLAQSGVTEDSFQTYLRAETLPLPDPFRLPDMERAAARVGEAAGRAEKVLVHGDYDVDGLMGAAILTAGLRAMGAQVRHFIPSRFDGGYGLSELSLSAAREFGATLLVTADCGTNPGAILDQFGAAGIDVVVTDHHVPQPGGHRAEIFVNAHAQEGHPDSTLCGASIAMQLVRAVAARMGRGIKTEPFLRLAALATVADVVPMSMANRAICRAGLPSLSDSPSPALSHLCRMAGVIPPVRSCHVGYGLAPRFNAAGRMENAGMVVDMLLERDKATATQYVIRLEAMNGQRKAQQAEANDLAAAQAALQMENRALVVTLEEGRFRGVVGPVAARLAERFGRSAFVMALEGEEYTGSARAANGDDVSALLSSCARHLIRFGGHGSAAGFTMRRENVEAFRAALLSAPEPEREPKATGYHRIEPRETWDIWETWGILDPFGPGNPEPYLGLAGLLPRKARVIKEKHLAWDLDTADGARLTCIFWGAVEDGFTPSSLRPGQVYIGKPVPESRPSSLPFFFQVSAVVG
jgi:single-stranded-DNA-specific exonuclease